MPTATGGPPRQGVAKAVRRHRRLLAAGLVGNVLEWYDFAIYGFMAPVIGRLFFPSDDPATSLIAAFGAFAAGFLMRPVGAVLFGHIGDRLGRGRMLILSVLLMAVPTFAVGLLPTHADIGIAAAVLLVVMRMAQGLSAGGEYVGSFVFLTEQAPQGRRGFFASWSFVGAIGGIVLGSAVGALVDVVLTDAQLAAWGWRVPFIAGIVVSTIALILRRHLMSIPRRELHARAPIVEAITQNWRGMLEMVALNVNGAVVFYAVFIYVATWLVDQTGLSHADALEINTISLIVLLAVSPFAAALSDRIGRKPILTGASFAIVVLSYPLVWVMHHDSYVLALLGEIGFAIIMGCYMSVIPVTVSERFPRQVRVTATGLSFNVTYAIFGGTTPMVAAWLVSTTDDAMSMAWYLIAAAIVSFVVAVAMRETRHEPLIG